MAGETSPAVLGLGGMGGTHAAAAKASPYVRRFPGSAPGPARAALADIAVIDTHVHLWDTDRFRYPWLAHAPGLNRPFLPADYRRATAGLNIEAMVFLQGEAEPSRSHDEVAWVTAQTVCEPRIRGIVARAAVERGEAVRDDLIRLRRNPLVRGVRRIVQDEMDPAFCLRPGFVRGVQLLAEFDLHFEICLKGDAQFRAAIALVRQCPGVRFVLDHIGKPFIREGLLSPWAGNMCELAALPNAWCKLSGLVNEAAWKRWTVAGLRPYIDGAVAAFGFDRLFYGGDWPVCTQASAYRSWVEALHEAVGGCTALERRKLFHDNAEAFYRLAPPWRSLHP
ncbi:MAG: Amidohydrolase [Lentisphaerae bacterium ADurb.BinA184]|nr:MAG: Amidohydrolase [Lentisphaerae bacterium ADurb.BinA184]